jgi:periplasmic divalent cation tolerance protein
MPTDTLLTLCTLPDKEIASRIAEQLVEQGYAACVNLMPSVQSVYLWHGKVESEEEVLLLIKTTRERYPDLEKAILAMHPYELPEIIAVPVELGLSGYLDWVKKCTK